MKDVRARHSQACLPFGSDLDLPGGVDESRFATRRNALAAVNAHFQNKEKSDDLKAMDTFYDRAYSLISSQAAPARAKPPIAR